MKRRGFTMIEVLVAVAVIAGLTALLFLGFKYVSHSTRGEATGATLQTLKGMLTEYEASVGSVDKLEGLYDSTRYVTAPLPPDFKPAPPEFPADFQVRAPIASVAADSSGTGRNDKVIKKTRVLMSRLLAVPSNQKVLETLPPSTVDRNADGPILLDSHGNPIIYVPSRGITGVNLGKVSPGKGKNGSDYTNPLSTVTNNGRGFWLSAGEDARFDQGDDNESSAGR